MAVLREERLRMELHPLDLVLDVAQARSRFGIREDALNRVDRPIE